MTTLLLVLGIVVIFMIGVISPHLAGKIEGKTDEEAHWLKRLSNWCWDPVTWWAKKTIGINQKVIDKAAEWGKKTRKEL